MLPPKFTQFVTSLRARRHSLAKENCAQLNCANQMIDYKDHSTATTEVMDHVADMIIPDEKPSRLLVRRSKKVSVPLASGVHTCPDDSDVTDVIRQHLTNADEPVLLTDLGQVRRQFLKWTKHLPNVQPHYSVKCNPDEKVIQMLHQCGASFDCATAADMNLVLSVGVSPEKIVYSNPIKPRQHLRHASTKGVRLMCFDSENELMKISKELPSADLLLRLSCEEQSQLGAPRDQWSGLIDLTKRLNVHLAGVSLHVEAGSGAPESFEAALRDAREVFDLAATHDLQLDVVYIGGGFPGMDDGELCFESVAKTVTRQLDHVFSSSEFPNLRVIAEPSKFFTHTACALLTKVLAKSKLDSEAAQTFRYYLNDGMYCACNSIVFDTADVQPELLIPKLGPLCECNVFGPAKWPMKSLYNEIVKGCKLPELHEGDHLVWRNMGAYTEAAATAFHQFPKPEVWYYWSTMEVEFLDGLTREDPT